MGYQCPRCLKRGSDLEKAGELKYVQGYAQCECGADLEDENVVKRIWIVDKNKNLDDGTLQTFDEQSGRKK